jgi:hypothetical protein
VSEKRFFLLPADQISVQNVCKVSYRLVATIRGSTFRTDSIRPEKIPRKVTEYKGEKKLHFKDKYDELCGLVF